MDTVGHTVHILLKQRPLPALLLPNMSLSATRVFGGGGGGQRTYF